MVFAESGGDFVDILLSFLTLPMGTIVRLLGKKSGVGCFDELYKSVEKMDTKFFETEACKTMLMQPRNASEIHCEDLKININDIGPRWTYGCPDWECYTKTRRFSSLIPGSKCGCGQVLDRKTHIPKKVVDASDEHNGLFVKGAVRYMISDDLRLTPFTFESTLSLFHKLGIKDAAKLQNMVVNVNKEQILSLLKGMLKSRTPLTDVLLRKSDSINCDDNTTGDFNPMGTFGVELKPTANDGKMSKTISVSLLQSKSKDKVVFVESGEDLVDQLFSFLTFPLGFIVKILDKRSSLGCVDNLYQSVKLLADPCNGYIKDEDCKNLLLSPKLATHFSCTNQLLGIDEDRSLKTGSIMSCESCFNLGKSVCSHGEKMVTIERINPKLPTPGSEHGGGFVKKSVKFLVADEMTVAPLSPTTAIDAVKELKMSFDNLIYKKSIWGEAEVLHILKACLTSPTVLSSVFSDNKKKRTC